MEKKIKEQTSPNEGNKICGVRRNESPLEELQMYIPPKELLLYCRQKQRELIIDYDNLLEKVETWESSCKLNHELQQELQRSTHEVQLLQQSASELQVCVQNEREEVLRLHTENYRLQMLVIEDRKKIELLLNLNDLSEHEVTYFVSSMPVPRLYTGIKETSKKKDSKGSAAKVIAQNTEDAMHMECMILRKELEQHIRLHRHQMSTLLKDRELIRREWTKEHIKLQNQICKISHRLKDSNDKLCSATKELISIKKETANKEINLCLERDKIQKQRSEKHETTLGVTVSGGGKSRREICAQVNTLKSELHEQKCLVSSYQEKCFMLERELVKHKAQNENIEAEYKHQMQTAKGQVTYLKKKYEDLDRRRKLDAEGFLNDVKILRKRLQNLEKVVHKFSLKDAQNQTLATEKKVSQHPPQMKQLYSTAQETTAKSQELEREIKYIMKKIREIEPGFQ